MGEPSPPEIDLTNPPFPLTTIDRQLLAMRDSDFHRITWDDLKRIIAKNTLEDLKRLPSDLRRYLAWSHATKQKYGSITNFVIKERLHWTPQTDSRPRTFAHRSSIPFAEKSDYAILQNDWPYGFAPGIQHLLIWTKTPIAVDAERGDVTAESRKCIEDFVERTFSRELDQRLGDGAGREKVMWFKNWVSLQSVRGVDHVHVLVRDVPEDVVKAWTERHDS